MGTNWYAAWDRCPCCGRGEMVHVGKSYRLLRAYREGDPTGPIRSWSDWRRWLDEVDATIVDEYGDTVDRDTFLTAWHPQPGAADETARHNAEWRARFGTDLGEYVDADGYRLSDREFS